MNQETSNNLQVREHKFRLREIRDATQKIVTFSARSRGARKKGAELWGTFDALLDNDQKQRGSLDREISFFLANEEVGCARIYSERGEDVV